MSKVIKFDDLWECPKCGKFVRYSCDCGKGCPPKHCERCGKNSSASEWKKIESIRRLDDVSDNSKK